MTIHFAAASPAASAFLGGAIRANLLRRAANDNYASTSSAAAPDRMLRDALKHFAVHGLGAAQQARREAERAALAGEGETYRYWLDICGKFDRRMATMLVREFGNQAHSPTTSLHA